METRGVLRRTTREAIIFTLLGPLLILGYYIFVEAYNAPKIAKHSFVDSYPNKDKYDAFGDKAERELNCLQYQYQCPPTTLPRIVGGKPGDTFFIRQDSSGLYAVDFKDDYYIQGYNGTWVYFPNGMHVPSGDTDRVIDQIPLTAYLHPVAALQIGAIFGWPLGLCIWIFYRTIKFAVKG